MKVWKWILPLAALAVVFGPVTTVIYIYAKSPEVFLNDRALLWVEKKLAQAGGPVIWKRGSITITSESLWLKRTHLTLESVEFKSTGINAKASKVEATIGLDLSWPAKLGIVLGAAKVDGGEIEIAQQTDERREQESLASRVIKRFIVFGLDDRQSEVWSANVQRWIVHRSDGDLAGRGSLRISRPGLADWSVTANVFDETHHFPAEIQATLRRVSDRTYVAEGKASTSIKGVKQSLACSLKARGQVLNGTNISYDGRCDILANFGKLTHIDGTKALFPDRAEIRLISHGKVNLAAKRRVIEAHATMDLPSGAFGLLQVAGDISSDVLIDLDAPPASRKMVIHANPTVSVADFGALVAALERSPWPIPAPFNELRGPVACGMAGDLEPSISMHAPFSCHVALSSSAQVFNAQLRGDLQAQHESAGWFPLLTAVLVISDAQVNLPPIDFGKSVPRLTLDPRITANVQKSRKSPLANLRYRIHIMTDGPRALRLTTNLVRAPVPLSLDLLKSNDSELTGQVAVENYAVELFRRQATIQYFRINFVAGQSPAIDGKAVMSSVEYQIYLLAMGTLKHPRFVVESDPPLPERDALGLALFGQPVSEMSDDQQRSSGDVAAAMTSGAITLASMFYLASTPIESVTYNPLTDTFMVKVKVTQNTVLTLGSEEEGAAIGIRRRLGHNWWVETKAVTSGESSTGRGEAMLRWAKRY